MSTIGHITLSGFNDLRATRDVYLDGVLIGRVIPVIHSDCVGWEAKDMKDRSHGDRWLKDWYAAEALSRSYDI